MTSADFCVSSVILRLRLLLSERFTQTSPGTTRFFLSIHLPHLSCMIPCSYGASTCSAVLPSCITSYVISIRQTRDLPVDSFFPFPHPASFRFHLTMDTLVFGYILPTTGRIQDFHLLETCAARRTKRTPQTACLRHLWGSVYYSNLTFPNQICLEVILCQVCISFDYSIYPYYPAYMG